MDLPKHYKLHSESDSHFVIHDERDGKQFKVAKKQLHPASQIKVMKMQKFDDGGKVKLLNDAKNLPPLPGMDEYTPPINIPSGFDVASKMTDNPYLGTALATSIDAAKMAIPLIAGKIGAEFSQGKTAYQTYLSQELDQAFKVRASQVSRGMADPFKNQEQADNFISKSLQAAHQKFSNLNDSELKQQSPAPGQTRVLIGGKKQNYYEGGDVEDTGGDGPEEGVVPQSIAAPSPEDSSKGIEPVNMSVPTSITNQDDAANANPNTMTAQDTSGTMGSFPTSQELKSAIGSQASGVEKEASATEKQNQALAAQYQKNIDQEQKLMESYNQKVQEKENQYNDLFSQVSQGKIDPKAYWKDHSKLGAAIGIMLGGIGAGLTRGPNLGLQVIQKNIENEIEAQKENLGNKRSLLSENLRSQGNMTGAMNATRLQMMAMAQGRIAQVAAQTGNPIIQAQAQQKIALMHQSTIPLRSQLAGNEIQMAIRKDVINRLKSPRSGGEPDVDMQDLARAGLVDKATAEKEQAAITKRQQAEAFLTDQVKKLDEEQSVFGGNFPYINPLNPESYKRRDQFRAGIIQTIQSASASKRLNPEMLATEAEPFLTKTMDSEKTREEGLTGLINLIRSHADATPQASHYNVPGALRKNTMTRKSYELGPVK